MAGKFSGTTTPGRGYTDAVPDERGTFSKEREDNFTGNADDDTHTGRKAGYGADPTNPPAGLEAGAASGSEDAGTESDEAPSGRVQGG